MDGDPEFVRTLRAQQNSLEFFPIFMGCLWICGIFFHQVPAAVLGMCYIYLRQQYFAGYVRKAEDRIRPFKKSATVLKVYLMLSIAGLAQCILHYYAGVDVKAALLHYFKGATGY